MTAGTPTATPNLRPRDTDQPSALSMLRSQVRVEQLMFWRNRSSVFFTFVFPLLLLVFLGMFTDPDVLVPGIAALTLCSTAFQALCIQLCFHRDQGVLKRLVAAPVPPELIVLGKFCSLALVVVLQVAVVAAIGVAAFGVGVPEHPVQLVAALVAGVFAFAALGFAVSALVPNGDAAPAIANAVQLPMLFICGVFYPVERLPEAVQYLAQALPLYHLVEPVRHAWTGAGELPLVSYAALAGWTVLLGGYALLRFRWEPVGER